MTRQWFSFCQAQLVLTVSFVQVFVLHPVLFWNLASYSSSFQASCLCDWVARSNVFHLSHCPPPPLVYKLFPPPFWVEGGSWRNSSRAEHVGLDSCSLIKACTLAGSPSHIRIANVLKCVFVRCSLDCLISKCQMAIFSIQIYSSVRALSDAALHAAITATAWCANE